MAEKSGILKLIILKYLLVILIIAGGYGVIDAQRRGKVPNMPKYDEAPIHFGFYLGTNLMFSQVKSEPMLPSLTNLTPDRLYAVEALPVPGFSVGLIGNVRLGKHFDFRFSPGLLFSGRQIRYSVPTGGRYNNLAVKSGEISSIVIDVPLHIKFKSQRIHNFRGYLIAGPSLRWDVYNNKQNLTSLDQNNIYFIPRLRSLDVAGEIGIGADFYMNWFKMGVELKYSMGFLNKLVKKDVPSYTNSIRTIKDNILQLVLTFE